jgi:non-reducing end alpha-L-arabinofuranosidase
MKVQSAVFAIAMASATILGACKTDDGSGTTTTGSGGAPASGGASSGGAPGTGGKTSGSGGAPGTGGKTGAGGAAGSGGGGSCTNVSPCGGEVLGTWTVSSSCISVSGELDLTSLGIGCRSASATGSFKVEGTWTAGADGKYTDKTTTKGTEVLELAKSCLEISGTFTTCDGIGQVLVSFGYSDVNCVNAASGGGCTCTNTVNQAGMPALLNSDPTTSGRYSTSGNEVSLGNDGATKYSYCVSGNKMTWTPLSTSPTIAGTIVFQNGTSPGAGGSSGGGGGSGKGGGPGSGGSTNVGSGGVTGTGTGGNSSGGGQTGQGGSNRDAGRDVPSGNGGAAGGPGTGGTNPGTGGGGGSVNPGDGPCDVYAAGSPATPCVAAYSMVRALSKSYKGPLFQVRAGSSSKNNTMSGGTTKDIGMLTDGFQDIEAVDAACGTTYCTVSVLYDQSGNGNDLKRAPKGNTSGGANGALDDYESIATKGQVTAGGHKVYSLYMAVIEGYRTQLNVKGKNMPLGSAAEGIYEVADGTHSGSPCCWDFGNVTTDPTKYGVMNTLFFGIAYWGKGAGSGPWFMADFEAGVWAGGSKINDPGWGGLNDSHPANPNNPSLKVPFAFGILKTQSSGWSLKMADVASASDVTVAYEGGLPKAMDNLGGIVLGVGGDNSNNSYGTFYEGAIVAGFPSAATDTAVFKNVKAVGYSK